MLYEEKNHKAEIHKSHHRHNRKFKYIYIVDARYGEGTGTPLQYSCLENPMDGGAKSWTLLSDFTFTFHF